MKKKLISMLLVATMALSLAACGAKDAEEDVVDDIQLDDVVEESDPYAIFDEVSTDGKVRSYLSGEWVDEEIGRRRPVALMIENTEACLPQYGINKASVVYECPVEGAITRTMAIFDDYSGMDKIGNTRSSRPYFVYFASEYQAIYFHCGGNPAAYELINDKGLVQNVDGTKGEDGTCYYRSKDAHAPHNLYIASEGMDKAIDTVKSYDRSYSSDYQPHFVFATDAKNELAEGEDCEVVQLYFFYNKPYFVYNSEDGLYYRYQFGKKHVDANDDSQVTATNIILQYCSWFEYTGSEYIGFDLPNNTGTGKYLTNGKMVDITWSKDGDTDVTHYYYNGEEIKLNPGTTWIELCQDTNVDKNEFYAKEADFK